MVTELTADEAEQRANDAALTQFAKLDLKTVALLLDVDGTLIDIGPSPFEVDVPHDLKDSLARLYDLTEGALALVSGRPIRDLDKLFMPLRLPAVGGHGAELRLAHDAAVARTIDLPQAMRDRLTAGALAGSGVEFEDKGYSVALHYRKAPQHEDRLRAHVAEICSAFATEETEVLPGKMMFEVKRPRVDKGGGVREVMSHKPFAGRMPVFVGDDITDDAAFAALPEFGGSGFSVNRRFPGLNGVFSAPSEVRRALQRLAGSN